MGTELAIEKPASESIVITVTEQRIEALRVKASALKIEGMHLDSSGNAIIDDFQAVLADKEGMKIVKAVRMEAVKHRTNCEKEHKAIKEQALRECQRIDKSRRDLVTLIEEIEAPLLSMENAVEAELDRLAKEKADRLYAARRERLVNARAEPHHLIEDLIRKMDDDSFERMVQSVKDERQRKIEEEIERKRLAEEQRIESERLAKERAEFEAQKRDEEQRVNAFRREAELKQQQIDLQNRIKEEQLAAERGELERLRREAIEEAEKAARDRLAEEARIAELNRVPEVVPAPAFDEPTVGIETDVPIVWDQSIEQSSTSPYKKWHHDAAKEIGDGLVATEIDFDWIAYCIAKHDPN